METSIEWCSTTGPNGETYPGYTFSPWWGCMKVSPACKHCYAETFAERFSPGLWGPAATTQRKTASAGYWKQPLYWNLKASRLETRLKVFCASMADVFEQHKQLPVLRERLWNLITITPNLDWLLLTKRPENVLEMIPETWRGALPANVWVGTSVESQGYANERIPHLLKMPARVLFLSCEPLQGHVDLTRLIREERGIAYVDDCLTGFKAHGQGGWYGPKINWVIAGGESGRDASPSHPQWFRSLRDQCKTAGVPFFFKQWGEYLVYTPDKENKENRTAQLTLSKPENYFDGRIWFENEPEAHAVRMGKHGAGNLLDGKKYLEMPV